MAFTVRLQVFRKILYRNRYAHSWFKCFYQEGVHAVDQVRDKGRRSRLQKRSDGRRNGAMIVVVANQCPERCASMVAELAVLRAGSGRKVLLLETDASDSVRLARGAAGAADLLPRAVSESALRNGLADLAGDYHDIVIDTGGRDTDACRCALAGAGRVIVPLRSDQVNLQTQYQLIARLNAARMFNPGLRVLFVLVGGDADPTQAEMAAVRQYVSHVMSAALASTVLHAPSLSRGAEGCGDCGCEGNGNTLPDARELHALCREAFAS